MRASLIGLPEIKLGEFPADLSKTSGTSPPANGLGAFPAHLFTPQPVLRGRPSITSRTNFGTPTAKSS